MTQLERLYNLLDDLKKLRKRAEGRREFARADRYYYEILDVEQEIKKLEER